MSLEYIQKLKENNVAEAHEMIKKSLSERAEVAIAAVRFEVAKGCNLEKVVEEKEDESSEKKDDEKDESDKKDDDENKSKDE